MCGMEKDIAARISLVTPRSFDPSKPRELQVKLEKKWKVIGKDFEIEKVDQKGSAAVSGTNFGSREVVKLVCMSDTHSTQKEFG